MPGRTGSDNVWAGCLATIVLLYYLTTLYLHRNQLSISLKRMASFKTDDNQPSEHSRLCNRLAYHSIILCAITCGLALTRLAEIPYPSALSIQEWMLPLTVLIPAAIILLMIAMQAGILSAIGRITYSDRFADSIIETKRMHLTTAGLLITPCVLLITGIHPIWDFVMLHITVGITILLTISFLFRSFLLFVRQKVSLLIWILYLCAVEIFPVALIWVATVKNL